MRRLHLRGRTNILKRLLIHTGGFNLGLLMRQLIGVGTPRGLQGRLIAILGVLLTLIRSCGESLTPQAGTRKLFNPRRVFIAQDPSSTSRR
jgi:transposase